MKKYKKDKKYLDEKMCKKTLTKTEFNYLSQKSGSS
ncbi:hypothetical protein PB1_03845 [Bacillus methanolicus PB1]|uniref:Uncharacterized protein n=1 Tax=Bacillus methanolicus PB1 TaxID=997296 RepID=I3E6B9_BACMT|nr:hypothetical protein PB1_03845 [Bacillus methanolicus PB1]